MKQLMAAPALALVLGLASASHAQAADPGAPTGVVGGAANAAGNAANSAVSRAGQTANGVVNGLQPTLQPVTQGVGGALNNLTQPDTMRSLLEFLAGVIPNHIEAHVNLDALRVEKLTVDVRGVDLRNLRVDLLVANSRGGAVTPMMGNGSNTASNMSTGGPGTGTGTGAQLPGETPIAGSSTRGR